MYVLRTWTIFTHQAEFKVNFTAAQSWLTLKYWTQQNLIKKTYRHLKILTIIHKICLHNFMNEKVKGQLHNKTPITKVWIKIWPKCISIHSVAIIINNIHDMTLYRLLNDFLKLSTLKIKFVQWKRNKI